MSNWRPTASLQNLQQRAELLNRTRDFFSQRNVLEVETPLACSHTVTEPNIDSYKITADELRYLQTSPEYAMKRLLAAGAPDIFQICKSFRVGEQGALHNPEFTIIEWYRHGFCLQQIMRETVDLILELLSDECASINIEYISYYDLTEKALGVSLQSLSCGEIKDLVRQSNLMQQFDMSLAQCIDFLFSHKVQPSMNARSVTVVFHYPAAQAALSKLDDKNQAIADRFEVFYKGIELANGYVELLDPEQQIKRFENDQLIRKTHDLTKVEIDQRLIEALEQGLPKCAGVAVGFDRVMMLAVGASSLAEVISFDWSNA
ncbi:MAG: EF-P lysine aminoacylase EpmA [Gammaproteobacteria bacterium]|nr:EF-P lysine aminoacylase EpmA [Gammaproteobacteria bacterium]